MNSSQGVTKAERQKKKKHFFSLVQFKSGVSINGGGHSLSTYRLKHLNLMDN